MFSPSARVVVLASSSNKQTSPKYGSIGYIINSGKTKYYIRDTVKLSNGVMVSPVNVLFTRYGCGKDRTSTERREILCVTPVLRKPSEYEKNFSVQDRVKRAVSQFLKQDFTSNAWYNIKCNHVKNPDYATICIMALAPDRGVDLMSCDEVELKGWIGSSLLNYPFKTLISKMCNHIYLSKFPFSADHREMLMMLNEATKSKSYRREFLNRDVFRSKVRRQIAIETLRGVIAIGSSRAFTNAENKQIAHNIKNGYYFASSGNYKRENQFFEMLMSDLYIDHNFYWKKMLVLESKLKYKKLITSRIEETKKSLKYLAQGIVARSY
jgi:hypothetical protein